MDSEEIKYFNHLKTEVLQVFTHKHAVSSTDCSTWSGQEIALFQEDFIQKVKSGFSEKWFYTYFKNDVKKLPRIDMLNLLSSYAGYQNYADFKDKFNKHESNISTSEANLQDEIEETLPSNKKKYMFAGLGIVILLALSYFIFGFNTTTENSFSFCFVEKGNQQAPQTPLRITLLFDNESPLELRTDENACFDYTTTSDQIKFVVQSPFHEPDTITRNIKNFENETIPLRSNDYALMLQYYTSDNVKDWKRKRERLDHLIANQATIYRVYPQNGIAIYSKKEFINQLTIPTEELKKIKILEIAYDQHQIVKLKFTVTE